MFHSLVHQYLKTLSPRAHLGDELSMYTITAKAMDTYDLESNWGTHEVIIQRNKIAINLMFLWFLERFPNAFPVLSHLLGLIQ